MLSTFDYIVCGAGAAGCVVVNRLSENPRHTVLLIEPRPSDKTFWTKMPRVFARLLLNEKRAPFARQAPTIAPSRMARCGHGTHAWRFQFNQWHSIFACKYSRLRRLGAAWKHLTAFAGTMSESTRTDAHLIASLTSMDLRSWDGWTEGPTLESLPGMQFMGNPTSPRVQGSVYIQSVDRKLGPKSKVRHMADEYDPRRSFHIFRCMRKVLSHLSLGGIVGAETIPPPMADTDEQILQAFDAYAGPGYQTCGSARIGTHRSAVIDPRLRVHGVSGVWVCDISIFPTQTAGSTNAPALATAWRAADLIADGARA